MSLGGGLLFYISSFSIAATNTHILSHEQWSVPRQATTIIEIPAIRAAVDEFQLGTKRQILITYPDGEVGTLWAHELRSWLVSLGISARFIELVPGSADPQQIEIRVLTSKH